MTTGIEASTLANEFIRKVILASDLKMGVIWKTDNNYINNTNQYRIVTSEISSDLYQMTPGTVANRMEWQRRGKSLRKVRIVFQMDFSSTPLPAPTTFTVWLHNLSTNEKLEYSMPFSDPILFDHTWDIPDNWATNIMMNILARAETESPTEDQRCYYQAGQNLYVVYYATTPVWGHGYTGNWSPDSSYKQMPLAILDDDDWGLWKTATGTKGTGDTTTNGPLIPFTGNYRITTNIVVPTGQPSPVPWSRKIEGGVAIGTPIETFQGGYNYNCTRDLFLNAGERLQVTFKNDGSSEFDIDNQTPRVGYFRIEMINRLSYDRDSLTTLPFYQPTGLTQYTVGS